MIKSGAKGLKYYLKIFWDAIVLPVGYAIALIIIFTSKPSPAGYWSDLKGQRGKQLAHEWGDAVLVALILAIFIRTFFIQAFKIPSGSMRMTLIEGDRLIVNKMCYGIKIPLTNFRIPHYNEPKRGDIVVFLFPGDDQRDFIKRLIAKGGEKVEIKDGRIYINGKVVDEPRIKNVYYYNRGSYGRENTPVSVPQGYLFVLGDNSGSSNDSRFWGFVPEDHLIGRAELIYWPPNRLRLLKDK